ncbi:MAG: type II secretion system F family protein [Alphaproteobacteria bacterium]|jgi:type IV pilus assembly protein PilC|nr:type II secretion system F family protein [Alphaproteobacteria bacterium]
MPLYAYKATSSKGTRHSGYRFAASTDSVYKSLKEEGLLLTSCEESRAERFLPRLSHKFSGGLFRKIPRELLIDFCHHMAQLDAAGVPIDTALHDLALSSSHRGFQTLLHILHDDVQVGIPLSEALARHPKVFDRVFQKLIAAAEQTGTFAPQFRHLEGHLRHLEKMNHQIQKALRSPLILFGLMIILVLVMIDFVIPNMTALLGSLGIKELPLSTRLLLYLAPILSYIPLVLLMMGVGLALGYVFPKTRYYVARFALSLPLYGPIALTHFWHVFGVLISAGVDLLPSLTQAIQVIHNPYLKAQLTTLSSKITAGEGLSDTFSNEKALLSPLMVRLLKLSEQTGRLKELIPQAASYYEHQTFRKVDTVISWLEPCLILLMGGLMVWIVMAVIVPFYGTLGHLT